MIPHPIADTFAIRAWRHVRWYRIRRKPFPDASVVGTEDYEIFGVDAVDVTLVCDRQCTTFRIRHIGFFKVQNWILLKSW